MARAEEAEVTRFDRRTFLTQVWDYRAGDCVTVLAPYGGGKTQLAFQLLDHTMRPELPAIVMVMKPRDKTITTWNAKAKLPVVRDWPPPPTKSIFAKKPPGWILWPRHVHDPAYDTPRHRAIFRRAILDSYKRGKKILFADETYSLEEEMDLTVELRTVWTKGRSMEDGLWAASQRAAYISKWAYQAQHLFLGHDGDVDAQRRLAEIGGSVNPAHVRWVVERLGLYEFLYINRDERAMCIVGP